MFSGLSAAGVPRMHRPDLAAVENLLPAEHRMVCTGYSLFDGSNLFSDLFFLTFRLVFLNIYFQVFLTKQFPELSGHFVWLCSNPDSPVHDFKLTQTTSILHNIEQVSG